VLDLIKDTPIRWTIFIPPAIWGDAIGSPMQNTWPLAVYAAIQKHKGQKLKFPKNAQNVVFEHVDSQLLGRACVWAATSSKAHGHFNMHNGDAFDSRSLFQALSDYSHIPIADEQESFTFEEYLQENAGVWDEIVKKYDLRKLTVDQLVGRASQTLDIQLQNVKQQVLGLPGVAAPFLSSRVKISTHGFTELLDTEDMMIRLFNQGVKDKLIPPF
jgi:hypothetical protein